MGLYTRVLVPIYDSCFAPGIKLFFHQRHKQCAIFYSTFWVSVQHHMLWAIKQRPSVFVPPTFLLVALFVMFSGAQRIYHSQEWPSNDCENDNQILKEIKNVINELTHLVKHLQNKELGQSEYICQKWLWYLLILMSFTFKSDLNQKEI